jgi:hypothetical protein
MKNNNFLNKVLNFLQSRDGRANKKTFLITIGMLALWLAIVIFTETRHEFWRDEIRALTLARQAGSPFELFNLIRYEGHPILWYLILFIGKSIFDSTLNLPIISILIGFSAVAIFMFYAPFPFWFRFLFIFNAFPLYEYSVMARNYGISMLLLFIAALLYKKRQNHPYLMALVLALLANTNVHAIIFSGLIVFIWVWDQFLYQRHESFMFHLRTIIIPLLIVFAGIALCILVILPPPDSILVQTDRVFSIRELIRSIFFAVLRPDTTFDKIMPEGFPSIGIAILFFISVLGLIRKPVLMVVGLVSYSTIGITFLLAYSGKYRHQGLFLIFLIFLFWLYSNDQEKLPTRRILNYFYKAGLIVITILILGNIFQLKNTVLADINIAASASKQFGSFLNQSEIFQDAIIVPEPDYIMESLPYYANNLIYYPREYRFGTVTSWSTDSDTYLSLGDLLSTARELKAEYNQPVLIAIGHWDIDFNTPDELHYSYNKIFAWNEQEVADFKKSTELLIEFTPAFTGEKYRVYLLN